MSSAATLDFFIDARTLDAASRSLAAAHACRSALNAHVSSSIPRAFIPARGVARRGDVAHLGVRGEQRHERVKVGLDAGLRVHVPHHLLDADDGVLKLRVRVPDPGAGPHPGPAGNRTRDAADAAAGAASPSSSGSHARLRSAASERSNALNMCESGGTPADCARSIRSQNRVRIPARRVRVAQRRRRVPDVPRVRHGRAARVVAGVSDIVRRQLCRRPSGARRERWPPRLWISTPRAASPSSASPEPPPPSPTPAALPPRRTSLGLSKYVAILACASTLRQKSLGDRFEIGWRYSNPVSRRSHAASTPSDHPTLLSISMCASSVPSVGSTPVSRMTRAALRETRSRRRLYRRRRGWRPSRSRHVTLRVRQVPFPSLSASIRSHSHARSSWPPRLYATMILRVWCVGNPFESIGP